MLSTSRTATVVPAGTVTFLGGGGGGGGVGTDATGAGGVIDDAAGANGALLFEGGGVSRTRGSRRRGLGDGEGLASSTGAGAGGGAVSAASVDATCRLLMTCLTPGSAAA